MRPTLQGFNAHQPAAPFEYAGTEKDLRYDTTVSQGAAPDRK